MGIGIFPLIYLLFTVVPNIYNKYVEITSRLDNYAMLDQRIQNIKKKQTEIEHSLVYKGKNKIRFSKGQTLSSKKISVDKEIEGKPYVICKTISDSNIIKSTTAQVVDTRNNIVNEILLTVELNNPAKRDMLYDIEWAIL